MWSYSATLTFAEGEASTEVHEHGGSLAPFLRELADAWRGFEDTRTYGSLEGQLTLSCRHDGLGSIVCNVTLGQPWPPEWHLDVVLVFGAGAHLDRIARDVEAFIGGSG